MKTQLCSDQECGRPRGHILSPTHEQLWLAHQIRQRIRQDSRGSYSQAVRRPRRLLDVLITGKEVVDDGRQIGKGSFATVFETKWLGDSYAKKEFANAVPNGFEDEVNALAKLNHPHIVKVIACNVASPPCFFLIELMDHDLRSYMNKRMKQINPPFSISAAIDLMLQLSEAMSYVNSQGMVHRDLKAGNLFVNAVDDPDDGFVIAKLADFGLAKSKHEVTAYSHMTKNQGTRKWMAPELFTAAVTDDENRSLVGFPRKADIYSFGIVCSEILTGKVPFFDAPANGAELYKLLTAPNALRPELPESCPESLTSLICKCWHTDPLRRPEFTEISTTLRILKGLYMMGGDPFLATYGGTLQTQTEIPYSTQMIEEQGLFGKLTRQSNYTYCDGPSTGIRAIKLFHTPYSLTSRSQSPGQISGFQVEFDLNGRMYTGVKHGAEEPTSSLLIVVTESPHWVRFKYPSEYLIQVKGSTRGGHVSSLTFIINTATYGPYGDFKRWTEFSSNPARVVGFFGISGNLLESIGVFTVPDSNIRSSLSTSRVVPVPDSNIGRSSSTRISIMPSKQKPLYVSDGIISQNSQDGILSIMFRIELCRMTIGRRGLERIDHPHICTKYSFELCKYSKICDHTSWMLLNA